MGAELIILRSDRRWIRLIMAIVGAYALGKIPGLSYLPDWFNKDFVETCGVVYAIWGFVNPFLDMGADDAKHDDK
jgi:uncharacterized membrane protein YhdT